MKLMHDLNCGTQRIVDKNVHHFLEIANYCFLLMFWAATVRISDTNHPSKICSNYTWYNVIYHGSHLLKTSSMQFNIYFQKKSFNESPFRFNEFETTVLQKHIHDSFTIQFIFTSRPQRKITSTDQPGFSSASTLLALTTPNLRSNTLITPSPYPKPRQLIQGC